MSRRRRRGDSVEPPQVPPIELPEHLEPTTYRLVDDMLWSFANRRLRPVLDAVGAAFLGPSRPEERKLEEIRLSLRAYATLGWADAQGNRIVDMFAAHGISLVPDQERTLASLRQAVFGLYAMDEVSDPDLTVHDLLRQETFTLRDRHAAASVEAGDLLLAWVVPSQTAWHPVGAATHVLHARRGPVESALHELRRSTGAKLEDLPSLHPVHVFWTTFRVVNALRTDR